MHEMSLANGIVEILQREARAQGFERVTRLWVEVGELSHVEAEALAFCFSAVTAGTLAENAELTILPVSGLAWCMDCSESIDLSRRGDPCPKCGGYKLQVTGGEELRVKELEVA